MHIRIRSKGIQFALALAAVLTLSGSRVQGAITDYLVGYLPFDGSLQDASGHTNHGAAVGTTPFIAGKIGQAVSLSSRADGTSFNYVTLGVRPDLEFGATTDFSYTFWVRFSVWTFDPPFIGNKDWLSGANQGYAIATGSDGRLQWNYSGPPGLRKDYDGPASTLSNGQWHHVAVTFLRAGEVVTYIDGQVVDVRDVTISLNDVDTLAGLATNIGQDGTGAYTDGHSVSITDLAMDDIGIWRRVVTSNEVQAIYQAGLAGQSLTNVVSSPEPPTLGSPILGHAAAAGETVQFKAVPHGTSPFTFQWQLNGVDLSNATTAILTLTNVQAGDAGNYTVVITNAAGRLVSDPANLTVDTQQAPVITDQPLSQSAALGGSARFKVIAQGVQPLSYQWRRNDADLSGQTGPVLSLSRVKTSDAGKYSVRVTAGNQLSVVSSEVDLILINDISKDLVAHLTFDADFQDSSGHNNHGTPQGTPTLVQGKIGGQALRFVTKADGSEISYVTLGNTDDLDFGFDADYSLSLWLKFSNWSRDPVFVANKSWAGSGSLIGYALAVGSDGRFQWNFKEQVADRVDYDSPPGLISDGNWHHIAVAFQRAGTATTWVDGQEIDTRPLPASGTVIDTGFPLNLGQDGTGAYTDNGAASILDGTMDDVAVWRRAITGDEVQAIYTKGLLFGANVQQQAITDGLVVHLPFDGDYLDRSGRQNNATAVGVPHFDTGIVGTGALRYSSASNGQSFNYVTLGAPADLDFGSDANFSVAFWTRFSQWTGDPPFIGNKSWASGGNQGWVIATAGNARVQWNLGDGDAGGRTRADYDGPANMVGDGQWHHVAVTVDRQGSVVTYLDGAVTNTTVLVSGLDSIDTPAGQATNIGQDGTGSYTDSLNVGIADGEIDDVGIWRRVLQPVEITQIYHQGLLGTNLLGQSSPPASSPAIQATAGTGTVTLAWPGWASDYLLEQTSSLGATSTWQPVADVTNQTVTLQSTNPAAFFRLRKPQ